jgi:hypothetical protein
MVILQQSSETFLAYDGSVAGFGVGGVLRKQKQVIFTLVRALQVVVVDVLGDGPLERGLAEENHPVEALLLDGPDETLGEGVKVGTSRRQRFGLDPRAAEDHVKRRRER